MIATFAPVSSADFDEIGYLMANPDVARAVNDKVLPSGRYHFDIIGKTEGRKHIQHTKISARRKLKLEWLLPLVQWPVPLSYTDSGGLNCLPDELAEMVGATPTGSVSQHDYDQTIKELIERNPNKRFLDAGAGLRPNYYDNVVNLEIVPYATTDVLGALERMPFADSSFDFVVSNAVLEHVRDPFASANEITRVLKPGGQAFIIVPFLQPYHGYPHHYFNMTRDGLRHLFRDMEVVRHTVPVYMHPVWVAAWFFNSWSRGLTAETKEVFERMTIKELMDFRVHEMDRPFVKELSEEKQFELASGTFLVARKR